MRTGQLDADRFVDFSFTNHIDRIKKEREKNKCAKDRFSQQPTYQNHSTLCFINCTAHFATFVCFAFSWALC